MQMYSREGVLGKGVLHMLPKMICTDSSPNFDYLGGKGARRWARASGDKRSEGLTKK